MFRIQLCLAGVFVGVFFSLEARAQEPLFEGLHEMLPVEAISGLQGPFALGDLDGDGDPDVVLAAPLGMQLNDGTGRFEEASENLPEDTGDFQGLTLADVDGDGDLDLVGARKSLGLPLGQATIQATRDALLLNDGTGVFTDASERLPASSDNSFDVVALDVEGDGDLDLVFANGFEIIFLKSQLLLNDGAGFFSDASDQLPDDDDDTRAVAFGDVDGDGDLDLVFGNLPSVVGASPQNHFYRNDGAGNFSDASDVLPTDTDTSVAVVLFDADGDLDLDLVFGNGGEQNRLYENDGAGVFSDATALLPSDTDDTRAVLAVDADGDGLKDLVFGNAGSRNRLYRNVGGSFAVDDAGLAADDDSTRAAASDDLDGDGDPDLLFYNANLERDRIHLNDGAGVFVDVTSPQPDASGTALATGDVDGDAVPDVLLAGSDSNLLLLGDGISAFLDASDRLPSETASARAALWIDVDEDGDLDGLLGYDGEQNRLYRNDGAGFFSDWTSQLPPDGDGTRGLAAGDVDGDADVDVLVANSGEQNRLLLGDGSGSFVDASDQLPQVAEETEGLALVDVDGDGDLDAVEVGFAFLNPFPPARLLLNDGAGTFTDASDMLPVRSSPFLSDVEVLDVEGDGDPDLVLADPGPNQDFPGPLQLLLNDGGGTFTEGTDRLPPDFDTNGEIGVGDVDCNGAPDLVADGAGLLLNDGAGFFSDASELLPSYAESGSFFLLDADGDEDLDLVRPDGPLQLWNNLKRHNAWCSVPRLDKPFAIDVFGPPGEPWFLGCAQDQTALDLPPFGTLRLDPSSLRTVARGVLDGSGRASFGLTIADPSLVGLTIYWQSAVGTPLRLTNLEPMTLSDL